MLASNFLTAEQLGVKQNERDALVTVLGMFERGEIEHARFTDAGVLRKHRDIKNLFNMDCWRARTPDCGTIHCIGGWAEHIDPSVFFDNVVGASPLRRLFYPPLSGRYPYNDITVEQAACALRNYLTIGEAMWDDVRGRGVV